MAALSICESLVIAMVEKGFFTVEEMRGLLEDAAAPYLRQDPQRSEMQEPLLLHHDMAVRLIERLVIQVDAAGPLRRG